MKKTIIASMFSGSLLFSAAQSGELPQADISNGMIKAHLYLPDAIMGPVESFGTLNYNITEPGGNFVQICVGVLSRPSDDRYNSFNYYSIADPGTWHTEKEADRIQFTQEINDEDYSYQYVKTVQLVPGKPGMVL